MSGTADESDPVELAGLTVLLVDDEELVRGVETRMLAALGIEVLAAPTAEQALELASERSGDLACALLDLNLPGMGGLELCGHLRRLRPELPVLFASGYPDEEIAFDGSAGRTGFLPKPYDATTVERALRDLLSGR